MKDKNVAGILALFFGSIGVHRFYLGQVGLGILYIFMFFFFGLSFFLSLIDAIVLFSQDKQNFDIKYNRAYYQANRRTQTDYSRQDQRQYRDQRREERYRQRDYQRQQPQQRTAPPLPSSKPRHNPYKTSGIEKYRDYDYEGAIEDFNKALELSANDVAVHFNLACAYSLTEQLEKSLYHLDRSVALGFNDLKKIKEHDALAFIRVHDEFEEFEQNGFRLVRTEQVPPALPEQVTNEVEDVPADLLDQIRKLNELKNKGLLTEEEFALQKSKLLR